MSKKTKQKKVLVGRPPGGEQGDEVMPLLFALGQHETLQAVSPYERLVAFLDDIYLTTKPDRVGAGYATLEQELRVHACIRVHW